MTVAYLHSSGTTPTYIASVMGGGGGTSGMYIATTGTTSTTAAIGFITSNQLVSYQNNNGRLTVQSGIDSEIALPDNTIISVKADGSYKIIDDGGKIKYKGNPLREFNPYINSSDMLEEFVDFVASVGGVSKRNFLNIPIELFIRWLVIRAAEADGDDLPEDQTSILNHPALLPAPIQKQSAKCKCCGRFINKKRASHSIFFCSTDHFDEFSRKMLG